MGGRGGSSGKASALSGVGSALSTQTAKMGGSNTSSGGVSISAKPFSPSKTPVSKMDDSKLRAELEKAAGHYYASGKSGISFGNRDPYQVAHSLVNQKMSRAKMEKDYKAIMKKLK